jgi:hypothetical protein
MVILKPMMMKMRRITSQKMKILKIMMLLHYHLL